MNNCNKNNLVLTLIPCIQLMRKGAAMEKKIFCLLSVFFLCLWADQIKTDTPDQSSFAIAIIGAGPAGIITAALLRDLGIPDEHIIWIDEEFSVGRLGKYYANVPGNLKTKLLMNFIQATKTFKELSSPAIHALLTQYNPEKEYPLNIIIEPLQDITHYLRTKIKTLQGTLAALDFRDNQWQLALKNGIMVSSRMVVLAIGSHPRQLNYTLKHEIPLDYALDKQTLAQLVTYKDVVAVVGSAHSAILILKFLSELRIARIVNFYIHPIKFAIEMGTWTLHEQEGLKGVAAEWAKNVLQKNPPHNLIRLYNTPETRATWLPICTKIIYAAGFERNPLPPINGSTTISYNDTTGYIAPGLFGIGIAFPEKHTDPQNNTEYRVGLPFFMEYAQRVIPHWISSREMINKFSSFDELFTITRL